MPMFDVAGLGQPRPDQLNLQDHKSGTCGVPWPGSVLVIGEDEEKVLPAKSEQQLIVYTPVSIQAKNS